MHEKFKKLETIQAKKLPEWKRILEKSVVNAKDLPKVCQSDADDIKKVSELYPMCINPYYFSLIKAKDDPIYKQCVPSIQEVQDNLPEDPLSEETTSPVPCIVHRYPDRVLFTISNKCAMYCRFCTRKRKVGTERRIITKDEIIQGVLYIASHPEVRDVILSGGDPLMLEDGELEDILKKLRQIRHLEIIRIGTRIPCVLPQRVTKELCDILKKYHPVYINTHFNHPREITEESRRACNMLADAGIPLGNQSVLLKGVNDSPSKMKKLVQKLLSMRVKPYYIYMADMVRGTNHFRTKLETGLKIIKAIRGWTSGMAVPHFVIDAPNGGGKIPILPGYLVKCEDGKVFLKNYQDNDYVYTEPN
ncbi:lysine 2,3-aminomutase [Candidatus Woesearchaeota archaeon CG10_big_fil_rev_8_21_14_0_10_34_12]|nr:MAG: lysine 2,3-aminomutase [Candidatus Woesearchaeota archaeon CG10_big_fil_rev_8_21_14_0_10_34_12]